MHCKDKLKRYVAVILILVMVIPFVTLESYGSDGKKIPLEEQVTEGVIIEFETKNPVFSLNTYKGTSFDELRLPDTLRVVLELKDEEKTDFVQQIPQTDELGDYEYYRYGYVAPVNEAELRENGELVIYTINYFDGSTGYRIYGSASGAPAGFYACDKDGNIEGRVAEVAVKWDKNKYNPVLYDRQQRLVPQLQGDFDYDGEEVYAYVTVSSKTEEEAETEAELAETEEEAKIATDAPAAKVAAAPRASTYTYDQAVEEIKKYTKTSGSKPGGGSYGTGVPGTWKDYVNSIFINKGLNEFQFTESGIADEWKWNGSASNKSGDPATDPNAYPTRQTKTVTDKVTNASKSVYYYEVYSVQQLLYALNLGASDKRYRYIKIMRDLDFDGKNHTWTDCNVADSLYLDGGGHKLYNLCAYQKDGGDSSGNTNVKIRGSFINSNCNKSGTPFQIFNMEFVSAFSFTFNVSGGGLFGYNQSYYEKYYNGLADNVNIRDSLFCNAGEGKAAAEGKSDYYNYGKHISPFGVLGSYQKMRMSKCAVIGSTVYGCDHVIGMITRANEGFVADNCFVTDTKICGTGGHSAGFISCQITGEQNSTDNCFTNIDMYGSKNIAGFNLTVSATMTNCFSTGKIEGYSQLYGFKGYEGPYTIENCYSTALVGMRSEATTLAGFVDGRLATSEVTNCYAAGEVGNHTTVLDINQSGTTAGGFAFLNGADFTNCFYDKQTTGMREWVTSTRNIQKGQDVEGITGVLTTDTDDKKAGNGLTSVPEAGDTGFTGFSGNAWYYEEGIYPQLKVMKDAGSADWGSQEKADLARANSLVSVSTVYLDTWDEGYDWNSKGVRSKNEVSYARTEEEAFEEAQKEGAFNGTHLGSRYTYDTVRGIITDFTSSEGASFEYSINGGNGANVSIENWKTGEKSTEKGAFTIGDDTTPWKVNHSGMEWLNITRSSSGVTAWRPIRLIAFMNVEAGADRTLSTNDTYDHRQDVELTIMDELSDNLVIGWDDSKNWSTAAVQGYPGYQAYPDEEGFGQLIGKDGAVIRQMDKQYYEVETAPTEFDLSNDAWMYTEIWLVEKDGEPLAEPESVRVTGEGTNGDRLSLTEQTWMGMYPMGMNMNSGMKFEITYYWMLRDGRYRTDTKTITLVPGSYDLKEWVYNEDGSKNSTALRLKTQEKTNDPAVNQTTSSEESLLDNAGGTKVLAAWQAQSESDTSVISLSLRYSLAGKNVGTDPQAPADKPEDPILYNPQPGDSISIKVPYYGYRRVEESSTPGEEKYDRLVIDYEPIYVEFTYTVKEKEDRNKGKIRYLEFDKEATYNNTSWDTDLESKGIKIQGEPFADMMINEMEYDIDVELVVSQKYNLGILKRDGYTKTQLQGVGFTLYKAQDAGKLSLDAVKQLPVADVITGGVIQGADGAVTDAEGKLEFEELKTGTLYYLAETEALDGYEMYEGYMSIKRDTDGVIRLKQLDRQGNQVGKEAVYNPDPDGGLGSDEIKLELADGNTVETKIDNYQSIVMPVSSGQGIMGLIITGQILIIIAGLMYLRQQKKRQTGH